MPKPMTPHPRPPELDASGAHAFSGVLRALGEGDDHRLTVEELVGAFGDRAFGAVMLVFAVISTLPLPPGSTTVTGVPLVLMAVQLVRGRERLWLPRRLLRAAVSRGNFGKAVGKVMPVLRFAERLTRPRLEPLVGQTGQRVVGGVCCVLAVVLSLPVPLGNILPAVAICLFSLGIMQRDGYAVIAGWIGTAASAAVLILFWGVVMRVVAMSVRMIGIEF